MTRYSTSHHITIKYITAQHSTIQYIISHHSTVQYITAQHITSQYSTSHHITVHHITVQYITSHHITYLTVLAVPGIEEQHVIEGLRCYDVYHALDLLKVLLDAAQGDAVSQCLLQTHVLQKDAIRILVHVLGRNGERKVGYGGELV
jgi:hypothetical protein